MKLTRLKNYKSKIEVVLDRKARKNCRIFQSQSEELNRMIDAFIEMSKEVHDLALALYRHLTYGEGSELIKA